MTIEIELPAKEPKTGIINLKNFIDKASLDGVDETAINNAQVKQGEMGPGDMLNSVKVLIEAAHKPLVELIKCLQKYVDNFRTEITIPHKNGNIILKYGRKMSSEQLNELITSILKNQ